MWLFMAYLCTSTGKNKHYGEKGERRFFSNWFTKVGLKEGWLKDATYEGKHPESNILLITPIDERGNKSGNTKSIK